MSHPVPAARDRGQSENHTLGVMAELWPKDVKGHAKQASQTLVV